MRRLFSLTVIAVLFFAGFATALPIKIIMVPSTDVQPYGTFHLGIENDTTMFSTAGQGGHSNPTDFGFQAGILNAGPFQVDAGVDLRESTDKPFMFNGKIGTTEELFGKWGPLIAAGAYDIGTEKGVNDYNVFYVTASKVFGFIGRASAGLFSGNANMLKSATGDPQNQGVMFAFDRRMAEVNEKLWLGLDYMSGTSIFGAVSFGIGWTFSEKASLVVGYVRYNDAAVAAPSTSTSNIGANVVTWQAHFDF